MTPLSFATKYFMEKKTPIYYSSRFWAYLYAGVLFVIISLQFFLGLIEKGICPRGFINMNMQVPIVSAAWLWTGILSLFSGFDRFVDIKNTQQLASGQISIGDLSKLRKLIVVAILIFLYATTCNSIVDRDFQLEALLSAVGSSIAIYISGNKLVKANRYVCEDKDADGIPDVIQKEYEKWSREQKRLGTDNNFITLEYFLDDHPEFAEKIEQNKHSSLNNRKR